MKRIVPWLWLVLGVAQVQAEFGGVSAGQVRLMLAGDRRDARFGLCAALAVVAGVMSVNLLTVTGFMNMDETVNEASIASVGSRNGDAPTSPEAEQSTLEGRTNDGW
jgi:hypothetical protein